MYLIHIHTVHDTIKSQKNKKKKILFFWLTTFCNNLDRLNIHNLKSYISHIFTPVKTRTSRVQSRGLRGCGSMFLRGPHRDRSWLTRDNGSVPWHPVRELQVPSRRGESPEYGHVRTRTLAGAFVKHGLTPKSWNSISFRSNIC
jgi:hypothetical protein